MPRRPSSSALLPPALLGAAALLAGCAAGPDFQPPDAPAVAAYARGAPETAPQGQRLASGADIPALWWRLYRSEALDALVRDALAASPTLEEARARLRQAQEDLNAETGGRMLPSVDGSLSAARQKVDPSAFGVPVAEQPAPFTLYNASISVSYTLDLFGADRRAIEAVAARADARAHEWQAARMTLAANVVTAAIRRAELDERHAATQALIDAQARQRDILERRLRAGGVSEADLRAQEVLLAQTRALLPPLASARAQAEHQLAVYLGVPPAALAARLPALSELTLPAEVPLGVPSALTRQRPDILAAEALWRQACAEASVAAAQQYPQFTLTAGFGSQRTRAGGLPDGVNVWNLGLGLTQPLFHGGELRARARSAQAAYEAAGAHYRQTVLDGFRQVADALRALQADGQAYQAQDQAWRRAADAERIARDRLRAGGISQFELLDAQRQLLQTRLARVQADAARYADTAALLQALGGGWWNTAPAPAAQAGGS